MNNKADFDNQIKLYKNEPENLYPDYRANITVEIAKISTTGECFQLEAKSGAGKSKYLRYISSSKLVIQKHFDPIKVKLYYFDLNRIYQYDPEILVKDLNLLFGYKSSDIKSIETGIQKALKESQKIYIIIDQAENLNEFPNSAIKMLRALRDQFKYKLGYILVFEENVEYDDEKLRYLLNMAPLKVHLGPLSSDEMEYMISYESKKLEVSFTDDEVARIKNVSEGIPRVIKYLVSCKATGQNFIEELEKLESEQALGPEYLRVSKDSANKGGLNDNQRSDVKSSPDQDNLNSGVNMTQGTNSNSTQIMIDGSFGELRDLQKIMTKNEYLFFQELFINFDSIVSRDTLANLLSPESSGEGVSNEAIDQIISRVRRVLKAHKLPYAIYNRRGVGYYLNRKK